MPRRDWWENEKQKKYSRHTQHDISEDLVVRHLNVANSDTQAQHLFKLEFDSRPYLSELIGQVFSRRYGRRELASCG